MNQQENNTQTHNRVSARGRSFEHWQAISVALMLYDFVAVCGAYFLALFLRFDCVYSAIPQHFINPYNKFILPYAAGCIVVFLLAKTNRRFYRALGIRPSRSRLTEIITNVPTGAEGTSTYFVGFYDDEDDLVAVMDLIT